jgi:L-seryl-tRNA(Ser) seleniumtransferase
LGDESKLLRAFVERFRRVKKKAEKGTPELNGKALLRKIPSVDKVVGDPLFSVIYDGFSHPRVTDAVRTLFEETRKTILEGKQPGWDFESMEAIRERVWERLTEEDKPSLKKVINCTGIVLHTNLGRAILPESAVEAVRAAAASFVNLEFEMGSGERGHRDDHVEPLLMRLTGAEAATVLNNNAGALVILLNTLCEGREAIVARGEFIEIGGTFRLPEIMKKSGCKIVEVGTTNRTRVRDYESAITPETGLILKVHTSNYRIVGFTEEASLKELVDLGRKHNVPVAEDLGSGALVDLSQFGLPKEPVVSESVGTGVDLVCFSGDKLLGGPQAGMIVGNRAWVERIRKNPLKRILRLDKLTLAALEATLKLYLHPEKIQETIPSFRYLTRPLSEIEETAKTLVWLLGKQFSEEAEIRMEDGFSQAGGGSLPEENLPTWVVTVRHKRLSPNEVSDRFRANDPPIVGRVYQDAFRLDVRCLDQPEDAVPRFSF